MSIIHKWLGTVRLQILDAMGRSIIFKKFPPNLTYEEYFEETRNYHLEWLLGAYEVFDDLWRSKFFPNCTIKKKPDMKAERFIVKTSS